MFCASQTASQGSTSHTWAAKLTQLEPATTHNLNRSRLQPGTTESLMLLQYSVLCIVFDYGKEDQMKYTFVSG